MKKIILTLVILMMGLGSFSSFSQNRNDVIALGLPGDNFNLYAVLDVFQKSKTLEDFEREINSRDSNINNLDLNNDGYVDYISVISYNEGHFYSIVLRDSFGVDDFQDVAVIEVSKNNAGKVLIQVIGDEALYGENYIVEPSSGYGQGTPNPGYTGGETVIVNNYSSPNVVFVNDWPIVISLFSPSFSLYISPWYWGYYPVYWSPWAPIGYYSYWNFHYHYYSSPYYYRVSYVRFPRHHSYYLQRRYVSPIVVQNRRSGVYRRTYEGVSYRRPVAPRKLSRTEVRREVRRSRSLGTPNLYRQRETESGRRQVQPSQRQQNRESGRRQVTPNQREENRQPAQKTQRESVKKQVFPTQRQENRELRQQPQSEPVKKQEFPTQRQENRPLIKEQRREVPREQSQPIQRQENKQSSRSVEQRSNRIPSINQPSRMSRQSGNEIRKINRSESRNIMPSRSSDQNRGSGQNRDSGFGKSRSSRR